MRTLAVLILMVGTIGATRAQTPPSPAEPAPKAKPPVRIPIADQAPAPSKPAAMPAPKKEAKATAAPKAAPKDAKQDAKKDAKKKEDEIGKIDGIEIARSGNRYLGIQIVGGNFKLNFYDEKKKPVAPDVARAVLRWDPKYKLGMERVVLTPGGGANSLTSEKFIRPPYNFKLTIVLLGEAADSSDGAEPGGETHVIDFRQ